MSRTALVWAIVVLASCSRGFFASAHAQPPVNQSARRTTPASTASVIAELKVNAGRLDSLLSRGSDKEIPDVTFARVQFERSEALRQAWPNEVKADVESVYADLLAVQTMLATARAVAAKPMPMRMNRTVAAAQAAAALERARRIALVPAIAKLESLPRP